MWYKLAAFPNYWPGDGAMPRYFFNLDDGHDLADTEGVELPTVEEAHRHARAVANEMSRNNRGAKQIAIIVTDEWGNPVASIPGAG